MPHRRPRQRRPAARKATSTTRSSRTSYRLALRQSSETARTGATGVDIYLECPEVRRDLLHCLVETQQELINAELFGRLAPHVKVDFFA